MTVKPETRLWKNLKRYLSDGDGYIVSRLESYVTPGFPDCLIFHNVTGFFTIELKIAQHNNRIIFHPSKLHGIYVIVTQVRLFLSLLGGSPMATLNCFMVPKPRNWAK